jgi:transposase-like protein
MSGYRYMSTPMVDSILKALNKEELSMPKNKIQFQRGLSLPKFLASYGTETKCRESLFHLRWPNGFVCSECGDTAYGEIKTRKLFQCKRCHRQSSVICGTIFASIKLPLTTWSLGIYLISQSKDGVSSLNLSRSFGISANAALRMKHKLQQVMKERDDSIPLPGIIQLDDAYWGGRKHDGKRGRGASGKAPFLAAVSTNLKGNPVFMRFSRIKGFTKDEVTQWSKNT